jgi:hypothetical protein
MVPNRNPSPSRALAVAAIVAFVVPLGACSDPPDSSGAGSNSAVSSVHEVPPGYVRAEQAGLLIKIPERWTPLDVHDAMVDPDAVAPEVKRLASERSLTIEQYVSMLRGADLVLFGPTQNGETATVNIVTDARSKSLPTAEKVRQELVAIGAPTPRAGVTTTKGLGRAIWSSVSSTPSSPSALFILSALGPNGLVTLTASGASVAEAKRCAMRITSQMVSWTGS